MKLKRTSVCGHAHRAEARMANLWQNGNRGEASASRPSLASAAASVGELNTSGRGREVSFIAASESE